MWPFISYCTTNIFEIYLPVSRSTDCLRNFTKLWTWTHQCCYYLSINLMALIKFPLQVLLNSWIVILDCSVDYWPFISVTFFHPIFVISSFFSSCFHNLISTLVASFSATVYFILLCLFLLSLHLIRLFFFETPVPGISCILMLV